MNCGNQQLRQIQYFNQNVSHILTIFHQFLRTRRRSKVGFFVCTCTSYVPSQSRTILIFSMKQARPLCCSCRFSNSFFVESYKTLRVTILRNLINTATQHELHFPCNLGDLHMTWTDRYIHQSLTVTNVWQTFSISISIRKF